MKNEDRLHRIIARARVLQSYGYSLTEAYLVSKYLEQQCEE